MGAIDLKIFNQLSDSKNLIIKAFYNDEISIKREDFETEDKYHLSMKALVSVLLSATPTQIIDIISPEYQTKQVNAANIPQFSNLSTAMYEVPRLLLERELSDVNYADMGGLLWPEERKLGADKKYGENHSKTAALIGLTSIENAKINLTSFGRIFLTLNSAQQAILIPMLWLKVPLFQNYFCLNKNMNQLYSDMSCLSESTFKRRMSNVKTIIDIIKNGFYFYDDSEKNKLDSKIDSVINNSTDPLQQIYYGAPGTGKSFKIDEIVNENNSVRTTFHPDSDYSTFVGCYKPVKKQIPNDYANLSEADFKAMADEINKQKGEKINLIIDFVSKYAVRLTQLAKESDKSLNQLLISFGFHNESYLCKVISKTIEDLKNNADITYEFIPQAFTTAYVNAWKNLEEPYYLVIEEINRGNCAQIFGDIFQLLDRDSRGMSSYKITPDKDLQGYLASEFIGCDIDEDIKSGEKMQLPSNLNILATMNTSDQSLFPIDSAFKRRWDWKYIPIDYTDNGHYITCGNKQYKWTDFLEAVNKRIESVTQSEDKKMGGWFVKPNGKEIATDKFVSKVVFYLWNDVFKDFGHDGNTIFKDDFDKFHKFFDFKGDVKLDVLEKFLVSLGLKPINQESQNTESTEEVQS